MEIAIIVCTSAQEAADARGYLTGLNANTIEQEDCTDFNVHTVKGQSPNATFPQEYHKAGNLILVTGKWT